jgi:hypothetical protein
LSEEDRSHWEEIARKDKARFEIEKSIYSGPWKVPVKKQLQDELKIPKRPMSAFFAFSLEKRSEVKQKNPDFNNTQISRHLALLWKEAKADEKKKYIDKEFILRQKYLADITSWRQMNEKEMTEQRKRREDFAMRKVIDGEKGLDQTTTHPQPADFLFPGGNNKPLSLPSEQVKTWNQYSDYVTHYNYYPVSTMVGYPPQSGEHQYAAYPQHYSFHSSTSSTQYDPPSNYSQPGEYSQYFPSRDEYTEVEWTSEQNFDSRPPEHDMQNYHDNVASRYPGKQVDKSGNANDSFLPNLISTIRNSDAITNQWT